MELKRHGSLCFKFRKSMRVLIVDDEPANVDFTARVLSQFEVARFTDPAEAFAYGRNTNFDVAVVDQRMPNLTGIELVRRLKTHREDFVALVVSAYADSEDLIDAVNSNTIHRYLVKPVDPDILLSEVQQAYGLLELRRKRYRLEAELRATTDELRRENTRLKAQLSSPLDQFYGTTKSVSLLKQRITVYATMEDPILIEGETGTGKELIARAIHQLSSRSAGPFYAVNCAAIPTHVVESELFGHAKGAFTGADRASEGIFSAADGGTLFLDEVAELPLDVQPKLLRVLQFGSFYPVGSRAERHCDVRVLAATNRSLSKLTESGTFREDLFYRINSLSIYVPPLRERPGDILPLSAILAERRGLRIPRLTAEAKDALVDYAYPGNVRELENILTHLHAEGALAGLEEVGAGAVRSVQRMPEDGRGRYFDQSSTVQDVLHNGVSLSSYLDKKERYVVARCYSLTNGNISQIAKILDLTRQSVRNKLRRYGLYRQGSPPVAGEPETK